MKLFYSLLNNEAIPPTRKHSEDAGADLYSCIHIEIPPNAYKIINTGITVKIPKGYFGWITNKSSKNYLVGAGIIDSGYQGELLIKIFNPTSDIVVINIGEPVAQLLIIPVKIPELVFANLDEIYKERSSRGNDGGIYRQL